MLRRLLLITAACLVVAACATGASSPAVVGSPSATPTASPSATASPASPTAIPPTAPPPSATPEPSPVPEPTRGPDEAWRGDAGAALLRGVRDDIASTCRLVGDDLQDGVLAELRCVAPEAGVRLVTLRVYASRWQLIDAWASTIADRGIDPMSHGGRCRPRRASEGGYVPGDGHGVEVAERSACWLARDGTAHYLATIPSFVIVRVDGLDGVSIPRLEAFAWRGNRDQPGNPTLWRGRR